MKKIVSLRANDERQPERLSSHDARRIVQTMAQDTRQVFIVKHAKGRQRSRRISIRQIMTCLQKGSVTEGPYLNIHGNWQLNMSRVAAGEEVTCVVAIEWQRRLIVVTVF